MEKNTGAEQEIGLSGYTNVVGNEGIETKTESTIFLETVTGIDSFPANP